MCICSYLQNMHPSTVTFHLVQNYQAVKIKTFSALEQYSSYDSSCLLGQVSQNGLKLGTTVQFIWVVFCSVSEYPLP